LDRGSINGTFLNNQRLLGGEKKLLNDGDTIRIQSFDLYFSTGLGMQMEAGATVQVARQMVMEVLGSWESQAQEKPRLIVMGGPEKGKQVELAEGKQVLLGRGAGCDIVIDHASISRKHAEVTFSWSGAFIKDLDSANGVYCNDVRIDGTHKLHDRDEIKLGQQTVGDPIRIIFSNPAEALLSKIEDAQITDSPQVKQAKVITGELGQEAAAARAMTQQSAAATQTPGAATPKPVAEGKAEKPEVPRKSISLTTLMIGSVILLGALGAVALLFVFRKQEVSLPQAVPEKGSPGEIVSLSGEDFAAARIRSIEIHHRNAPILKQEGNEIQIRIPAFSNMEGMERQTEITLENDRGEILKIPFTLVVMPSVQSVHPVSGMVGSEVRIQMSGTAGRPAVYFGAYQARTTAASQNEVTAIVPEPTEPIPSSGMLLPVTIRVNQVSSKNSVDFTILSKPIAVEQTFRLTFNAKTYSVALGFNEFAVETNIGPLLILVARDSYGTSSERASAVASNLNEAVTFFQSDPEAKVVLQKEQNGYALYAQGIAPEQNRLLLRVFQEDTLAYSKINQRVIALEALADWWQMLLGAYYKVFVQVQNPAETGILSAGGSVLQQIYDFYSVGEGNQRYYKKDFLQSLPADQQTRLIGLSLSLPLRVASVEGKWNGSMSNILYSTISEPNLEIILILRQGSEGNITGTAEMNWKIAMGGGGGGYQNAAFRRLGMYSLNGTYRRNKAFPLEFSFVEKDGRRLQFVGKLEAGSLRGSFAVSATGQDGTWRAQLQQ
jgi:pSer/pThr/pTyr-binding forkhead associated (FHA) protein